MSRVTPPLPRRSADAAVRLALTLALVSAAAAASAATRYEPRLRFRSVSTPHFVIHFHQGLEPIARRLAAVAEEVHLDLTRRMGHEPGARTHVVLVDQHDVPNGWATPLPYNLIEISAAPPSGASLIGNTADWLRLVFTHEYAHVLHLDRSRGWAGAARRVFGRAPFAFPNLTLPLWHVEGLATFEESGSGQGRLDAGDFHAIVREAARREAFEPIDRVNGGLVDWPAGHGWYAYGGFFHAFLAERYGRERMAELSDRTAGRLPYLTAGAFRTVYGRSLGELWREYRDAERAAAAPPPLPPDVRRLTFTGHAARGPRFDRDGRIVYSRSGPHGLPALETIPGDGGAPRELTSRIGGEHIALTSDSIYFDQLELQGSTALTGDLYRLDRTRGAVERLTRGARLADPDVSPDGRHLAVVRLTPGGRDLWILRRDGITALPHDAPEVPRCAGPLTPPCAMSPPGMSPALYASPRWSPDGRRIAAERRGGGGISEIVVIDATTGAGSVLVSGGRNVTPAWLPDGSAIVFASDRDGPFDLYLAVLSHDGLTAARQDRLTRLPGGAHSPDVAADGRSVVFVGYSPDGYDLYAMSLPASPGATLSSGMPDVPAGVSPDEAARDVDAGEVDVANAASYSPAGTLAPRAWLPALELDDDQVKIGATTGAVDALGYHAWQAYAVWPVVRGHEFSRFTARPDLRVAYVYDRWRPTLFADLEDDTTWLLGGPASARVPFALRDRAASAGMVLPFRRMRWSQTLFAAWRIERRTTETSAGAGPAQTRGALRAGWGVSTAKRFGYSISPEAGVSAGLSTELAAAAFGADADASFTRLDVRAFVPAAPRRAVVALRGSVAASRGDAAGRRTLRLGGAGPEPGILSFDEDATSLLRGFPASAFQGDTAALLNAEYRVPIAWPQRGAGTWPLFLRALHGTVFADGGHAWTGRFRLSDLKTSWGAELSADVVAGYQLPLTVTTGIAWGRDHAGRVTSTREVYVRLGQGF